MQMRRNLTEAFLRDAPIQWGPVPWWEDYEGEERVQKRMKRIKRQLNALYTIADLRLSHASEYPSKARYRRAVRVLVAALVEKELMALARRSAKRIKAHLARLAAALEQCSEPKPNGVSSSAPPPLTPPSDDPDYDALWEERMWWQIHGDSWMQFNPRADGEDGVLDEEAIVPYLPQRKRDSVALRRDRAKSSKWGCESHRPHRSWKDRRRTKWRVLGWNGYHGYPTVVLS